MSEHHKIVESLTELRKVSLHENNDRVMVRPGRDIYIYEAANVAPDDGNFTVKPDDVLPAQGGRWSRILTEASDIPDTVFPDAFKGPTLIVADFNELEFDPTNFEVDAPSAGRARVVIQPNQFDPFGEAAAERAAHEAASDPHPQYTTGAEATAIADAAVAAHEALADPHAQYQKESEKGAPNGYASLDGTGKVPDSEIPAGIARDAEVTAAIAAHEAAADPHPAYQKESEKGAANGYASLNAAGDVVEPATKIKETGGPTVLTVDAIADGHLLKRAGATVVGVAPASVGVDYGRDRQLVTATGRTTTTSSTFQTKATLVTPAGLNGTYRLRGYAVLDNFGNLGEARLAEGAAKIAPEGPDPAIFKANDNAVRIPFLFEVDVVMVGVARTFLLQWRDQAGGNTQGIQGAFLEFFRVV